MNIALIYGGRSGEHEISLVSAASIARGIDKKNKVTLIGITKDGRWFLQSEKEYERICKDTKTSFKIEESEENKISIIPGAKKDAFCTKNGSLNIDVVFPALHGTYGEDGTIQGLLDMADIPYIGCSTIASALTMDKEKTKQILKSAEIPIVPYICIKRCDLNNSQRYDEIFQRCIDELGFPLFIKPCCAGSSNGANKATTPKELSFYLMEAFTWDDKVLVEKAINAREIECSVTGNSTTANPNNESETVRAYIPGEIQPKHTFYDFDAKYNDPDGAELLIPANISTDLIEAIRTVAVRAYKALDCSGLSRVDFFIDKDTDSLYLNEINTLPGFTSISMFPKMCEKAGLKFPDLVNLLIDEAILRYKAKSSLTTSR
ncbi:MAG: D-alanine--D-alanine ligase family protein [Treponema sp.]|jgi:D-alanine-D-alanine ligase|nr:D-alanine--D-alanine ligase family protein [Treponema sp.]